MSWVCENKMSVTWQNDRAIVVARGLNSLHDDGLFNRNLTCLFGLLVEQIY